MSRLFLVLAALFLIVPAGAEAGIVVIDLRRADAVSAAAYVHDEESDAAVYEGEPPADEEYGAPEPSYQPRDWTDAIPRSAESGRVLPPEQQVDAKVDDTMLTEEELMGCGGAQATGGPASLLPIALALLATLLRKRRKLHAS